MADRREVWIQLFSAALAGVAAGSPGLTEVGTTQRAGKIADAALKELLRRDSNPEYEKLFAGSSS